MSKALSNLVDFQDSKNPGARPRDILILLAVLFVCAVAYKFSPSKKNPKPDPLSVQEVTAPSDGKRNLEHPFVKADVQMALILDTSASMDGLIRQAREQILEIVSDLQKDENGKTVTLSVALYRYGSSEASSEKGYIQCLVPLTTDHESIVEALSWLQAGGSEEYAPMAIATAVEELAWDPDTSIPKVIVIVGNETFAAGPKATTDAFNAAQAKKIRILPIYCVGEQASTSAVSGWRRAAHLAGADLEMIDPNLVIQKLEEPIPTQTYTPSPETQETLDKDRQDFENFRPQKQQPDKFVIPDYQKPQYIPAASAAPRSADFRSGVRRGMTGVIKSY